MRSLSELPAWERLFKEIIWKQLGEIKDQCILDFGSGEGITADHFAGDNTVTAVEPWEEMLIRSFHLNCMSSSILTILIIVA